MLIASHQILQIDIQGHEDAALAQVLQKGFEGGP